MDVYSARREADLVNTDSLPKFLCLRSPSLTVPVGLVLGLLHVQNNLASARFGEFFNTSWREYRAKFVLEF